MSAQDQIPLVDREAQHSVDPWTVATLLAVDGLPVFPCNLETKQPCTAHGFKDASTDLEEIQAWCNKFPAALIGVPTGTTSGLLVVDIDPAGAEWYVEHAVDLACGRVHTTRRGHHLLYRMPEIDIRNSASKIAPGVDVRANGGYVIWWPAQGLTVVGEMSEIAPPPIWLLERLHTRAPAPAPAHLAVQSNTQIPQGQRNQDLTSLAGKMRHAGATPEEIEFGLGAFNSIRCVPPLTDQEVRAIAQSVARYAPSPILHGLQRKSGPYELIAVDALLGECDPPTYVVDGLLEEGIFAGIVGPPESGKSLIALNLATCVATGKDFHGRAVKQGLVVYLAGEGHGGIKRRLQAIEHSYAYGLKGAPLVLSKTPASFLDPVEVERVAQAIREAVETHKQPLVLLIVDTVIRYLSPGNDDKSQDIACYQGAVDYLRGDATALSLHHPGHADATRARGSSNWRAGLDAEFSIANSGEVITVTCQKMKDGDRPAAFSFRIEQAPTMATKGGFPVMSVVIVPTYAVAITNKPSGKNQKLLLAALEEQDTGNAVWTEGELRAIGRTLGMHRNSAREAVLGLRQLGYFTDTIGGSQLTHRTGSTEMDRKTNSVPDVGTENAHGSIGTVLSVRPSVLSSPWDG